MFYNQNGVDYDENKVHVLKVEKFPCSKIMSECFSHLNFLSFVYSVPFMRSMGRWNWSHFFKFATYKLFRKDKINRQTHRERGGGVKLCQKYSQHVPHLSFGINYYTIIDPSHLTWCSQNDWDVYNTMGKLNKSLCRIQNIQKSEIVFFHSTWSRMIVN